MNKIIFKTIGENIDYLTVFCIYNNAVVFPTTGITLEFVNGKNLWQFGGLERNVFEVPHCSCAGNIKLRADF